MLNRGESISWLVSSIDGYRRAGEIERKSHQSVGDLCYELRRIPLHTYTSYLLLRASSTGIRHLA
jgi:hypothetical protein